METISSSNQAVQWLAENCSGAVQEIAKPTQETRAWFATFNGRDVFIKWFPSALRESWAKMETAIAGTSLDTHIIPLRQLVNCADGTVMVYDWVRGENLGAQDIRTRFSALPLTERAAVVAAVAEALAAICDAGVMVVDWYEGNMIYDFDTRQIWLFDWELCRDGGSFILEMNSNYGSSRLMAPEEFVRGSTLDQITLVFNLGRYALLTVPEIADSLAPILARATYPARSGRYQTLREYVTVLSKALAECPL